MSSPYSRGGLWDPAIFLDRQHCSEVPPPDCRCTCLVARHVLIRVCRRFAVVLLEEAAGWDQSDSWFHALEEEPMETSISPGTTALGEAELPSDAEINHNTPEHHSGTPGSGPPAVIHSNPRLPPEPRNPYGQMVRMPLFWPTHALHTLSARTLFEFALFPDHGR